MKTPFTIKKSMFTEKKESREKRINKILNERMKGKSLEQISTTLGITRERVRQIVALNMTQEDRDYFNSIPTNTRHPRKQRRRSVRCSVCGTRFFVSMSSTKKNCSKTCARKAMTKKYMFTETVIPNSNRSNYLWHHDEKYRKVHRKRMHDQWMRNKKNPAWMLRYNERQKVLTIRCAEKKIYGHAKTPIPEMLPLAHYEARLKKDEATKSIPVRRS